MHLHIDSDSNQTCSSVWRQSAYSCEQQPLSQSSKDGRNFWLTKALREKSLFIWKIRCFFLINLMISHLKGSPKCAIASLIMVFCAVFAKWCQWLNDLLHSDFRQHGFKQHRRLSLKLSVSVVLRAITACLHLHGLFTTCCAGVSESPSLRGSLFCVSLSLCQLYSEAVLVSAACIWGHFSRYLRWAWFGCLISLKRYKIKIL